MKQAIPVCSVLPISLKFYSLDGDSHLPDDFPGESDVVEQRDKEGHADKDIGSVWVSLDKRGTGSRYKHKSRLTRWTDRLKRY